MPITGFFVDWNGDTRRTEQPGDQYECIVNEQTWQVDVVDSDGGVVHEGRYFPTLEAVEAAGVTINLIQ
jgi:hypothetical protein